jgi:hypothetical protein
MSALKHAMDYGNADKPWDSPQQTNASDPMGSLDLPSLSAVMSSLKRQIRIRKPVL